MAAIELRRMMRRLSRQDGPGKWRTRVTRTPFGLVSRDEMNGEEWRAVERKVNGVWTFQGWAHSQADLSDIVRNELGAL
jgi:hypothetical protein